MAKFYKTVFTFEVLSEKPIPDDMELGEIYFQTIQGDYSGKLKSRVETKLTGKEMAKALIDQESDPGFFQLDKNGRRSC